jgi:HD-GYP domain-containing protein (c-di-GMP phosphodiesterase class II)
MFTPEYGLKSFVHRTLALRLLIGGSLIAILLSMATYLTRYDDIGQAAIVHAVNSIERLRVRVRAIGAEPGNTPATAIQQALDEVPEYRVISRYGQFVYARFYTPDGATLAHSSLPGGPEPAKLDSFLDQSSLRFPALDEPWHDTIQIDERPYIQIAIAVADKTGVVVVYGEGLYALTDSTIAMARSAAFRTAAYVMLIVVATSLLLYPVILSLTNRLANFSERLLSANLETIQVLGNSIAKRDSDTDAHNYRVTLYAVHLAEAAGLDTESTRGLIKGAFLHDVGKIGIRDHILHKPAKLDDAEFDIMKTHVNQGLEIISRSSWLDDAMDVVGSHHEKFDGSGYPQQLQGEKIPLGARIFAITDVFDALTSRRPYKEPFSFEETMQILEQGRGTHFDPRLLDLFATLAEDLYQRYGGREDEQLPQELKQIVQRYFAAGLNSLVY